MCSLNFGASMNFYLGCSHSTWSEIFILAQIWPNNDNDNNDNLISGPHSEHVKHGWGDRNPKSCSLLCLKGRLISVHRSFLSKYKCTLSFDTKITSLHWEEWWKPSILNCEQTNQIQRFVISLVDLIPRLLWKQNYHALRLNWQQSIHSPSTLVLPRSPDQGCRYCC